MTNRIEKITWEQSVLLLKQQQNSKEMVEACFYDDPLIDAARRYANSTEWAAARTLIRGYEGKVLDVGAGRGISSFALACDGWDVTALEPDGSAIVGAGAIRQLAAETSVKIDVVEQWGERLPFKNASFDLVHCRQVLHHASNLKQLCLEIGRVLKPGGRFIATREHVVTNHSDIATFQSAHPLHQLYGGEYAYKLSEYLCAIKESGIEVCHVMNPNESDINLYPETRATLKKRWAKRLHLPYPQLIPNVLLTLAGAISNAPGRLYTFVGNKA